MLYDEYSILETFCVEQSYTKIVGVQSASFGHLMIFVSVWGDLIFENHPIRGQNMSINMLGIIFSPGIKHTFLPGSWTAQIRRRTQYTKMDFMLMSEGNCSDTCSFATKVKTELTRIEKLRRSVTTEIK
jgi:hypothetical protein